MNFPRKSPTNKFRELELGLTLLSRCENREITINYINLKTMTWTYDCIQGWVMQAVAEGLWRRPRRGESSKGDDEDWDWTRRKSMGGDRFTGQRKAQARMLWLAKNNVQQCKVVCEVLFSWLAAVQMIYDCRNKNAMHAVEYGTLSRLHLYILNPCYFSGA